MRNGRRYRQAIVEYLDSADGFSSARGIAMALNILYKSTIDALNALCRLDRVARIGRKFCAKWGSAKAARPSEPFGGWNSLAAVWLRPHACF
jgi:hypothetical protein